MAAGIWTHRDLVSGTFTFLDLLDAHELLDVKFENERRAHEHYEKQNEQHGR